MIEQLFGRARRVGIRPSAVIWLLLFRLGGTVLELVGLAGLVPVAQYIQASGNIASLTEKFEWWVWLREAYAFFGLEVTLGGLLMFCMSALLLRQGFVYVKLRYQAVVREKATAQLSAKSFAAFIKTDREFQESKSIGSFVNDLTIETSKSIEHVFSTIVLAGSIAVAIVYFIALLSMSISLTIFAAITFGIVLFFVRSQIRKTEVIGRQIVSANQAISDFVVERLRLAKIIRLAGMQDSESTKIYQLTSRQAGRITKVFNLLANLEIIIEPLVVGVVLIFIYVSVKYFDIEFEILGLFIVMLIRLLPVMKEAAKIRQSRRVLLPSFVVVTDGLDRMMSRAENTIGEAPFIGVGNGIQLDGVHFSYGESVADGENSHAALNGVDAFFPAGKLSAIVGPSGAGKSTLFDLLPRLREFRQGQIRIGDVDIRDMELSSLRRAVSYAPQTAQFFNIPIKDHIRYGRADVTDAEMVRAASLANADGFIRDMRDQYATFLGDNGGALSGGQRQRVDLARALLSGGPILLLDEPTSNLDPESEAAFTDSLKRIRDEQSITCLLIAHRPSTVLLADHIVVLIDGRVAAAGAHAALASQPGWYRDAFLREYLASKASK